MLLLLLCSPYCYGQDTSAHANNDSKQKNECCADSKCCPSLQIPVGVMTAHVNSKGQWMLSYLYTNSIMEGGQVGTTKIKDDLHNGDYQMSPQSMSMQMHMVMAMYGVTDRFTIMGMWGFSVNDMSMRMDNTQMGMPGMSMASGSMSMTSSSGGITDTRLYGLYNFSRSSGRRLVGSMGIVIPTGTIHATGETTLGSNQRLPYAMQIGTGSFSLAPDVTYYSLQDKFTYGINIGADIKLNYNQLGYKAGNSYHANIWGNYQLLQFVSCSIRAEATDMGKITGADPAMDIPAYQSADPSSKTSNYGGTWLNIYGGVNIRVNQMVLKKWTFRVEYGIPLYQNLNGTQTSLHGNLLSGIQYNF
jgi:hypothetical protein